MNIRIASHLGMCFGVRDAIKLAKAQAASGPLTILGDLVHNQGVLQELEAAGVSTTRANQNAKTKAVMITAHGTSDRNRTRLASTTHQVHDATCPLVHYAHRQLQMLVSKGCFPIVIGRAGHVEVRGLVDDFDDYRIVLDDSDLSDLPPHQHYGVVAQTTQPIQRVDAIVKELRRRYPTSQVTFRDTVCQPTKQRQTAAVELAQASDIVIVIGGSHSNNTHELVRVCSFDCQRVHHIQSASQLERNWFRDDDRVGITAGTSTPDHQIAEVIHHLEAWSEPATVAANAA